MVWLCHSGLALLHSVLALLHSGLALSQWSGSSPQWSGSSPQWSGFSPQWSGSATVVWLLSTVVWLFSTVVWLCHSGLALPQWSGSVTVVWLCYSGLALSQCLALLHSGLALSQCLALLHSGLALPQWSGSSPQWSGSATVVWLCHSGLALSRGQAGIKCCVSILNLATLTYSPVGWCTCTYVFTFFIHCVDRRPVIAMGTNLHLLQSCSIFVFCNGLQFCVRVCLYLRQYSDISLCKLG